MSSKKKNGVKRGSAQHQNYINRKSKEQDDFAREQRFYGEIDAEQIILIALAKHFQFGPKRMKALDEAVREERILWADAIIKDWNSQQGKKKGYEKEQEDFDKELFRHLPPEMHYTWEQRRAWDAETAERKRWTLGICVGETDAECFLLGKNKKYRKMIGLDKDEEGELKNDG